MQGHLHKLQQNLQSTKSDDATIEADGAKDNELDIFPAQPHPNKKCNHMAYMMINPKEVTAAYQDLTRLFPVKSSKGNEYILAGYHYNKNYILGHPVKDKEVPTLTKAWKTCTMNSNKQG